MPKYTHDTERWLRSNAELYRRKGNQQMARNFEMCAEDVDALRARVERLEELVQRLLDNNPNETIADNGATVLCAWRHDARRALEEK